MVSYCDRCMSGVPRGLPASTIASKDILTTDQNSPFVIYRVDLLTRKCELVRLSFEVNDISFR